MHIHVLARLGSGGGGGGKLMAASNADEGLVGRIFSDEAGGGRHSRLSGGEKVLIVGAG